MPTPSLRRENTRSRRQPLRWCSVMFTALLAVGALVVTGGPAVAASGPEGQTVNVSQSDGLNPEGQTVTVTGSGFDTSKGIYVSLCVDNGPNQQPTPCLGGVDMEGAGGASAWISSNPPAYGEGVAEPFTESGGSGSFEVTLSIAASDAFTDCLDPAVAPNGCVIGTRADHTRTGDRSADVRIPVTFATGGSAESGPEGDASAGADPDDSAAENGPAEDTENDAAVADADEAAAKDDEGLATTGASVAITASAAAILIAIGAFAVYLRRHTSTDPHSV